MPSDDLDEPAPSSGDDQRPRHAVERVLPAEEPGSPTGGTASGPARAEPTESGPARAEPTESGPARAEPTESGRLRPDPTDERPSETGPSEARPLGRDRSANRDRRGRKETLKRARAEEAARKSERRGREQPAKAGPPPTSAGGRVAPRRARRTGKQRAVLLLGILSVFGVVSLAVGILYVTNRLGAIERTDAPVDLAADESPLNILVVGSDSRENIAKNDPDAGAFIAGMGADAGKRSDTIMVVRVNPKTEIIDILSLPRDLWLPIAVTNENQRLNSTYSESPDKLIATIKQFLGIEINHFVEVDFKGFKGIVDAVGGVPMYFDKPMRDGNSGLRVEKAGCQTLNGEQALAFARSRHLQYKDEKTGWKDDVTGDIGRIDRQQFFIRQVFEVARLKALSPDLRATNQLLDAVVSNVKVDKSMDVNRMASIGRRIATKSSDQLVSWSLPVTQYNTAGGASVVRMAADEATPILDVFRGLTPDAWPTWAIKMTIVGSSGTAGHATQAQTQLQELGFVVAGAADAKPVVKRTIIKHPIGYHRIGLEVARRFTGGADVVEDKNIQDFTLVVTLGSDFSGTTAEPRPLDEVAAPATSSTPVPFPGQKASAAVKAPPTTAASTTTSTEYVMGGKNLVGVVPGKPPADVTCSK